MEPLESEVFKKRQSRRASPTYVLCTMVIKIQMAVIRAVRPIIPFFKSEMYTSNKFFLLGFKK